MEDVLETYQKLRGPNRPLVCLDETSKQLIVETRAPIPAKPGQPARHDFEYERNGVANLFMMFAPLEARSTRQSDRPSRRRRLRTGAARTVGPAFSRRRQNRPGSRQSQQPHARLARHGLTRTRSAAPRQSVRMPLHAQTWELARNGRIRTRRSDHPMPKPPHPRQADPRKRGRSLAASSKQTPRQGRLAIHKRTRPSQTQEAIPQFQ